MTQKKTELSKNRKAYHDYEITETYEAGLSLVGTEVKSLREHGGSLNEAYIKLIKNELWLVGAHIAPYAFGNIHNHEERRSRKLLMHNYEVRKFKSLLEEKGLTLVPLSFYVKKGKIKIKIGLAKGRKQTDKRAHIKEKEAKRQMDRAMKNMR